MRRSLPITVTLILTCLLQSADIPAAADKKPVEASQAKLTLLQRVMTAADKDKDGKLSLAQFKTLDVQALHHGEEHFKEADLNKDGFIDSSELAGALSRQTWFALLSEGTEVSFTRLDLNKDTKLDLKEFRPISKMGAHTEQHFKSADTNKDGFLDLAELSGLAEHKIKVLELGPTRKK
jgi:Ca2+-binding EF-hand superfamily protein